MAQVIARHLGWLAGQPPWIPDLDPESSNLVPDPLPAVDVGLLTDLCPECGEVSPVTTQGCASCISGGYSEC